MEKQTDQAREHLAQQRHHQEQRQDTMRSRTEAEMHQADTSHLEEQSREALARQRRHNEHLQDTLRERSEEEID